MTVNRAILVGRLGADPELRYTPNGTPVTNFRIATSEYWNDKQGQRQERTEWHRLVAWGKVALNVANHLTKGRQVYVEGRIRTRQWEDRDGNKRFTTEIHAQNVSFLGSRPAQEGQKQGQKQQNQPTPADLEDDFPTVAAGEYDDPALGAEAEAYVNECREG